MSTPPTGSLERWTRGEHTADDLDGERRTHPTWRRGDGPGVVVVHEIPGITPEVVGFADEVVDAGFTVVMPELFGRAGGAFSAANAARSLAAVCVSKEFTALGLRRTSPVAGWLRSLARSLHAELGGPGVGALGMCFTGGFGLAMMVDEAVAAPVLCQPSAPFPVGSARAADLGLSPGDLDVVRARAGGGCSVLGVRYRKDPAVGTRFATLERELGEAFTAVELEGRGHSTVTMQRQDVAVERVLAFLRERLQAAPPTTA